MDISVEVNGLAEIIREMEKLGGKEMLRMTNNALRAGAREIRDQAVINAKAIDDPNTPTSIPDNIVVRAMSKRKRNALKADAGVRVGVLGGAKQGDKDAKNPNKGGETFHWRFIEFGTRKASGKPVPANPFMRKAVTQAQARAIAKFFERYNQEFQKQLNK